MGVLRKWFGPSKAEMWRKLSDEIGAQYHEGSFWKGDKVEATHGEWTVTLDTFVVMAGKTVLIFTRMRAPFVNPEGFRFSVSRAGFFTDFAKMLGMQDVTVGHEAFDEEFVIKGSDEDKLRTLFGNARVRELVDAQKDISFAVKDGSGWLGRGLPEDTDELEFTVMGIIKDVERLKLLYELFAETLDQLCLMGTAYEQYESARDRDN